MTSRFAQWTLDVQDVHVMAEFWSRVLGYQAELGADGSAKLYPPSDGAGPMPPLWLQTSAPVKTVKNRSHPDLRPLDGDVDAEVDRLLELGARRVDVGQQPDDPFVVLADPEGNEFCVLRREPLAARS
jgi:hypothetical protein